MEKLPPEIRTAVQGQVLGSLTRISAAGAALVTRPVAESFADGRSRREAFVRAVLPEIDALEFGKAAEIADFIQSELYGVPQREKIIGAIQRCLRAYIKDQPEEFIAVLFTFFIALERYLRANIGEFVCHFAGMSMRDAATASGVANADRKHFSFGDLIALYRTAIQKTGAPSPASPGGAGWQNLVELRNRVSHGEISLETWREGLTTLLNCWPSIVALADEIAAATKHPFVFRA